MAFRRSGNLAAKVLLSGLSQEVEREVAKHPERVLRRGGFQFLGQVCLPHQLQKAIRDALQDYSTRQIRREVAQLSETLRAKSNGWPQKKSDEVELGTRGALAAAVIEDAIDGIMAKEGRRTEAAMQPSIPIKRGVSQYTDRTAAAYMAARMPNTYAALVRIFHEIKTRLPEFHPLTMLDYGTGTGSVIWAMHEIWPTTLDRIFAIESAPAMYSLCTELLEALPEAPRIQHFTSLDVASRKLRGENRLSDLVVAAYTVGELPEEERENIVRRLWSHTRDILVLVEPGTPKGWQAIAQARQQVLVMERRKDRKRKGSDEASLPAGAHVVAPCPHDGKCPMEGTVSWCHFPQRVQRSEVQRLAKRAEGAAIRYNHEDEKFSFVVLRRGPRPQLPAPLHAMSELQAQAKDVKTLKEEAFQKQAIHMRYLQKALSKKHTFDSESEEVKAWASKLRGEAAGTGEGRKARDPAQGDEDGRDSTEDLELRDEGEEEVGEGGKGGDEEEMRMMAMMEYQDGEEDEDDKECTPAEINSGWARIVRAPRRRGSHAILDVCCSADAEGTKGELQRHILTKNTPRVEFRFARKSHWGDLWPM